MGYRKVVDEELRIFRIVSFNGDRIDRIIKQWIIREIRVNGGSIGIPNLLAVLDFEIFDIKLNSHCCAFKKYKLIFVISNTWLQLCRSGLRTTNTSLPVAA